MPELYVATWARTVVDTSRGRSSPRDRAMREP
jgi:hypothetical protein